MPVRVAPDRLDDLNMTKRLIFILTLMLMPLMATAQTQTPQDRIIAQLDEQGYEIERLARTLLGRVRIVSTNGELMRETVFNPATGHILRDITRPVRDREDAQDYDDQGSSGSEEQGGGSQEQDDDSDDDDDDDAEDESDDDESDDDDSEDDEESDDD